MYKTLFYDSPLLQKALKKVAGYNKGLYHTLLNTAQDSSKVFNWIINNTPK
jgi:hypothetical protein